ncbi:hypothetical protein CHLNCDRAFT_137807 [Chlorella variabilis]|uniref:F-box domain-containing protein n=1 Tax=Chlorella variabilis TaxID=554065 RepID=E1Z4J4_CHLVA|nr:hypothetical protein CHLNCDRAFT_137807 [Chlorella variabilis]EFN59070.1 hypothetical protein CHLNCDRAFT_137807 [Chlorella variabilis]|eukprot:XP_005851172.1 hypothetical protein CHLNCDRAFT_137807 [Chlorella variabilis]
MATLHRPKTRAQTSAEQLRLLHLPDACLASIMAYACNGLPWKERCRLAEVCRAFHALFSACAFSHRPLVLNLNTISWRILESKRKAAARREAVAAVARVARSATHLALRYQLDPLCSLGLDALLAPLAPHVQVLEVEDGLCPQLLRVLGGGGWGALREVGLSGCNLWIDLEPAELALLEGQLAALPALTAKITKFECSCQGMAEGGESFRHLTALRSLELEDWMALDLLRDYSPLRTMRHLTRLVLSIVEDLEANLPDLRSLTQARPHVRELSLVGCYRASRGLAALPNLVMLDLQPLQGLDAGEDAAEPMAAAAWKASTLSELRWCGDLVFDGGDAPIQLPRLTALEIDEAYFPPSGFHTQLCASLTQLTSLRLVGGRCARLPPAISRLARLQVLAVDSCQLPAMPVAITALTAVTNLQLSNTGLAPHLPPWVLSMPVRKLWLANNALSCLLPPKAPKMSAAAYEARKRQWLSRLTHVCLSSNCLRELPSLLLQHAASLQELDLAYNHSLQISAKCADSVARVPSLRLLRLEKSYWLRLEDRWTKASLRAITRLKQQRPDMQVDFKHETPGGFRLAW